MAKRAQDMQNLLVEAKLYTNESSQSVDIGWYRQSYLARHLTEIAKNQLLEMKEIANDMNLNMKHELQVERDSRSKEFNAFVKK